MTPRSDKKDKVLGLREGARVTKAKGKGRVKKEVSSEDEEDMGEEDVGDEMDMEKTGSGWGPGESEEEEVKEEMEEEEVGSVF